MAEPLNRVFWEFAILTSDGTFLARYSKKGLCQLSFPAEPPRPDPEPGADAPPTPIRLWNRLTETAVKATLAGRAVRELPPLDIESGSPFQQSVWQAMLAIPLGQTRSYGEIARIIGRPAAVRAVGGACGANPIPVLIPCHRVLAAGGKLGGFSGGLDWKRLLLGREAISLFPSSGSTTGLR